MENEAARHPIWNMEAEEVILGAILNHNAAADRVADVLKVEDFASLFHQRIYSAIINEISNGRRADAVLLRPMFRDDPALEEMQGGAGKFFADLTANNVGLIGIMDFARQVSELGRRRRLSDGLEIALEKINDTSEKMTFAEAVASIETACMAEQDFGDGVVMASAADAFREMMDMPADEGPGGVTAPDIPSLNAVMGPIKPHHMVVMAGRPGMGKTAVALSYAISAAREGKGVLFVSREMSRIELMQRAASSITFDGSRGVPYSRIRDNDISDTTRKTLWSAGREFADMPLHIVDAAALSIGRLNMLVRRYKRRMAAKGQSLDLVIIDYLQLLSADGKTNGRYEEITAISVGIKAIAKSHDLGVIALAQLSRDVEKRESKRPILSDLRDSGQIEQDADKVVFLYRDEYYIQKTKATMDSIKYDAVMDEVRGKIEFIVAKRRDGEEGTGIGQFHGMFMAVRG